MDSILSASIVVNERQRKMLDDIDDEFVASVCERLIHPIVIRISDGNPTLVVGGRRLAALIKGGTESLERNIHYRIFEDLDPITAKQIEYEENAKRTDLPWRDQANAVGELHKIYANKTPDWRIADTAKELHVHITTIHRSLFVYKNLDKPILRDAKNIDQAYSILQVVAERQTAAIISQIASTGTQLFSKAKNQPDETSTQPKEIGDGPLSRQKPQDSSTTASEPNTVVGIELVPLPSPEPPKEERLIIVGDFLKWAPDYSGPKFNLIHVDFPYGIDYSKYAHSVTSTSDDYEPGGKELYENLLGALCSNVDRFVSYSAHMLFWFTMDFYERTRMELEKAGFYVHVHPFIWHKTDNSGIIPGQGNQFPRRIYETAFLCSRGKRPLIRSMGNAYGAPTPSKPIHPSQKSEPMLTHFLTMLVDEVTDVFDPTAGSGAALRAADSLGARSIFGLELNSSYADAANALTVSARNLRKASASL